MNFHLCLRIYDVDQSWAHLVEHDNEDGNDENHDGKNKHDSWTSSPIVEPTYIEVDGLHLSGRRLPIYNRAGGSTLKSLPSDNQRPSTEEENGNRHERLEQCDAILNSSSSEIPAEAKALAVLKAFREHLPADGLGNFVDDILACANLGGMPYMQKLGDHLLTAILIPFKILSLGPPSLKHRHDLLGSVSQHANGIKHLSETTFARDGRRCVYTGNIDIHHVQDGPEPETGPVAYTASRHILPYGLKDHTEDTPRETEAKRAIWWSIHRYFPALAGKIDGFSIDQPANVLTLNESVSSDFGECHLAFKPLPTENEYEVVVLGRISSGYPFNTGYHITKMVLSAHNALDLPDRDFLDMHHRMARMLSETDIVEEIQSRPARRDTEDPCDQSSTDVAHIFPFMLTCLSNL
ncbi:unnamed protein product [Colletotrichum noveboracense]|uniref:HNH nuclease domain-containing protein n=1 Tax=Colletotrichum noveboracense TaxID=2664923 RepID=A0A9W4WG24_9PEZI|nr:unnamed protein product [Colletotrichum noveboracense]